MIKLESKYVISGDSLEKAIRNKEFEGFETDYLVIDSLLRIHKPKKFLELGTNMGRGTKIIKNALGEDSKVYSLDLPTELAHISLQHPVSEGKGDSVGHLCDLPYTQLRADSLKFDYSTLEGLEGAYIDGEHDYDHPYHESLEIMKLEPKIIIWHDADIVEVEKAIVDAMNSKQGKKYMLFRVEDCRIAFALHLKKTK